MAKCNQLTPLPFKGLTICSLQRAFRTQWKNRWQNSDTTTLRAVTQLSLTNFAAPR